MSYRRHPDQAPLRHCDNCGCVLTASDDDFTCDDCVEADVEDGDEDD